MRDLPAFDAAPGDVEMGGDAPADPRAWPLEADTNDDDDGDMADEADAAGDADAAGGDGGGSQPARRPAVDAAALIQRLTQAPRGAPSPAPADSPPAAAAAAALAVVSPDTSDRGTAGGGSSRLTSALAARGSGPPPLELVVWGVPRAAAAVYASKGLTRMYDWQAEALAADGVAHGRSLVYCAPTSGGKSLVAEVRQEAPNPNP